MEKTRKRFTPADREDLVRRVRDRGEHVAEAAARIGVSPGLAYSWLRAAERSELLPAKAGKRRQTGVTFARLVPAATATAVGAETGAMTGGLEVRVGGAVIEVRAGFEPALLRAVVAVLLGAAE